MEYREATVEDMMGILRLLVEMHAETIYGGDPDFKFDAKKMAMYVMRFINNPEYLAEIAVKGDNIVGIILGDFGTMIFGNGRQAREKLLYVHKDYRGTITGPRLMKRLISWAKSISATEVMGQTNTGINPERTEKLWGRRGLEPLGHTVRARL